MITQNSKAQWVFNSISRDDVMRTNSALFTYINGLVRDSLNEDVILSGRNVDPSAHQWI